MKKTTVAPVEARQRIIAAAIKEFSRNGFSGARMEKIATAAKINKAMIFYYFASKEQLYKLVLKDCLSCLFVLIGDVVTPTLTVEQFLEKFPRIYITYFRSHPDLLKIIGVDLMQNPASISAFVKEIVEELFALHPKVVLLERLSHWSGTGASRESDPRMIIMNVMALSLFAFFAVPMIEAISGLTFKLDDAFYEQRIASVVNLLKRGMLP
jgi:TetR/AcrR family transcriptional regulator